MATLETPTRASPYFVSGPVDFLAIGGLAILAYLVLGAMQLLEVTWLSWTYFVIASQLLFNYPHFFATSYRLYHSRENIRQYPMTAIVVPIVLLSGAVASLGWPTLVAPLYIKLFLFWSPYHYAAQSVGISLLYARRAGFIISGLERWALSSFILSTFLVITTRENVVAKDQSFWGLTYPSFHLPAWTADLALGWMALCGALLAVLIVRWSVRNRRLLPLIVLVPAIAQFCWFVVGSSVAMFYSFIPFFHGLQYMFIAWATQLKEKKDEQNIAPSRRFVLRESVRWTIIVLVGGLALFEGLPRLVEWIGFGYAISLAAVVSAVNLHHFFVDGVIWKLRNPRVGSVLTTDLAEMTGSRPV